MARSIDVKCAVIKYWAYAARALILTRSPYVSTLRGFTCQPCAPAPPPMLWIIGRRGRDELVWWRRRWRVHADACAPCPPNASWETLGNLLSRTGLWSVRDNNFLTFQKNFTYVSVSFVWHFTRPPAPRRAVRSISHPRTLCIVCAHDFIKSETSLTYFKNAVTSSHTHTRRPFMSHGRSQGEDMIIDGLSYYI